MHPTLVIGGGLAGAALATHLSRAGREVLLLEREAGPHDKVCGEFLSYEAQAYLKQLDVDAARLGAVPIGSVAVLRGRTHKTAPLTFTALSLSRRVLDEAVLARATQAGADVRRGVRATSLERDGAVWIARTDTGQTIEAQEVFLATGKHDVRGWKRPPGVQHDLLGFKMYWHLNTDSADSLDGRVELHLFAGGYAGLQKVEGDRANLCLVVRKSAFSALGGRWDALIAHLRDTCPGLKARLEGGSPCAPRPLAIGVLPYGYVRRRSDDLWRLGDQAAVIPSFTGEGMSIALHSARLAASFALAGRDAGAFQRRLAQDVRGQVWRATVLTQAMVSPSSQAIIARMLNQPVMSLIVRKTRIAKGSHQES